MSLIDTLDPNQNAPIMGDLLLGLANTGILFGGIVFVASLFPLFTDQDYKMAFSAMAVSFVLPIPGVIMHLSKYNPEEVNKNVSGGNNVLISIGIIVGIILALVALGFLISKIVPRWKRHRSTTATNKTAWDKVFAQHDHIKDDEYDKMKNDLDYILSYPAIDDMTQQFNIDYLNARERADLLRPQKPALSESPSDTEYGQAVRDLVRLWDNAKTCAERLGTDSLTTKEKKSLHVARSLWTLVNDDTATRNERALAADQLRKVLKGFLSSRTQDAFMPQLEKISNKQLTR